MPDTVMVMCGKKMRRNSRARCGSSLIEFVLRSMFWVTLLIGTLVIGGNLIKSIQVVQLCRDVGLWRGFFADIEPESHRETGPGAELVPAEQATLLVLRVLAGDAGALIIAGVNDHAITEAHRLAGLDGHAAMSTLVVQKIV